MRFEVASVNHCDFIISAWSEYFEHTQSKWIHAYKGGCGASLDLGGLEDLGFLGGRKNFPPDMATADDNSIGYKIRNT